MKQQPQTILELAHAYSLLNSGSASDSARKAILQKIEEIVGLNRVELAEGATDRIGAAIRGSLERLANAGQRPKCATPGCGKCDTGKKSGTVDIAIFADELNRDTLMGAVQAVCKAHGMPGSADLIDWLTSQTAFRCKTSADVQLLIHMAKSGIDVLNPATGGQQFQSQGREMTELEVADARAFEAYKNFVALRIHHARVRDIANEATAVFKARDKAADEAFKDYQSADTVLSKLVGELAALTVAAEQDGNQAEAN